MTDPRIEQWANVLVDYSVEVKAGDTVAIVGEVAAELLLRAIYRAVVERGGFPVLMPALDGAASDLLRLGTDEQLQYVSPLERIAREEADVLIRVAAASNTRANAELDPARQRLHALARADLMQSFMRRAAEGTLRWTGTLFPTAAYAQDADMGTEEFTDFYFKACKLDQADPIAAWRTVNAEQARLIAWLEDKSEIRVVGSDTDLVLSYAGRRWNNSDGHRNFPSGEIFTGPIEDSANGHVRFSYPVVTAGREIEDIRLHFADGAVVDATAARNEAYLIAMLDSDEGARRLGEFAFGTNYDITRFCKNILLDEKIGGTIHLAVGAGYPDTGSTNRSAIHWDMICDVRQGGRVEVDSKPFLVDGQYVV
ncbi:MAG: aminopeptidase [Thermomicrobiales bacterium]